jgi:Uma2 family endonuclease
MLAPEVFAGARARRVTRVEYERMADLGFFHGERVELIHGIVVRMPPIGPPHAEVVDRLNALLVRALGDRARVRIQQPFLACDDSEPEPDVAVVPARSYIAHHPDQAMFIIEVAETSLTYDRETKGALYAGSSVAEYWIVDVIGRCVEVFTDPNDGQYASTRRVTIDEELSPLAFPDVTVRVIDLLG